MSQDDGLRRAPVRYFEEGGALPVRPGLGSALYELQEGSYSDC